MGSRLASQDSSFPVSSLLLAHLIPTEPQCLPSGHSSFPPTPVQLHPQTLTMEEMPSASSSWMRFTGFSRCCSCLLCLESCR